MKKQLLFNALIILIVLSAVFAGFGLASIEAARTAPHADIVLPINHSSPQGITCADGGVLSPVYDENANPPGNRVEMWCLPFHPEGK